MLRICFSLSLWKKEAPQLHETWIYNDSSPSVAQGGRRSSNKVDLTLNVCQHAPEQKPLVSRSHAGKVRELCGSNFTLVESQLFYTVADAPLLYVAVIFRGSKLQAKWFAKLQRNLRFFSLKWFWRTDTKPTPFSWGKEMTGGDGSGKPRATRHRHAGEKKKKNPGHSWNTVFGLKKTQKRKDRKESTWTVLGHPAQGQWG